MGRTIYKLGNSVELSSREGKAKLSEQKLRKEVQTTQGYEEDSPVEDLRDVAKRQKKDA